MRGELPQDLFDFGVSAVFESPRRDALERGDGGFSQRRVQHVAFLLRGRVERRAQHRGEERARVSLQERSRRRVIVRVVGGLRGQRRAVLVDRLRIRQVEEVAVALSLLHLLRLELLWGPFREKLNLLRAGFVVVVVVPSRRPAQTRLLGGDSRALKGVHLLAMQTEQGFDHQEPRRVSDGWFA